MKLFQSLSGKIILLIFSIFVVSFVPKLKNIASGEDTCLCGYDGYGYYLYLPHFFTEGNLDIKQEWAQQLQNEYCGGIYAYQIVRTEKGKELNTYHMGQAFIELPAYALADIFARLFNYKSDGFSKPYYIAFILNALLFIFLGLLYLRKTLLLFFNERITAITILALYLASNIYITFFYQTDLQHLYLFALNAIFIYHLLQFTQKNNTKHLIISAIILGLTVAIRPTQVLLGIFPTILLLSKYKMSWSFFKRILIYPAFGLLWNLPQIAYWWIIGGEPFIPNLHSEEIVLSDPNIIDFLFSYKKGWILYSPIFILLIYGYYVLFRLNRALFWSSFIFLTCYIWVMSAWECWWYAQSYGSRVMVDIYPVLAIVLGMCITQWKKRYVRISGYLFLVLCSLLTSLQIHQSFKGYFSFENMTKQHYWYIFGQIDIPTYTDKHLEMNRGTIDPNWIQRSETLPTSDYKFSGTLIYELVEPITILSSALFLTDMVVLDKLPTDEGMLRIEMIAKTADSTKSAILMTETFTGERWYNWSPVELSLGQKEGEFVAQTHYVNLQRMRHRTDKMQFYINAPDGAKIDISSLTITALTLTRK